MSHYDNVVQFPGRFELPRTADLAREIYAHLISVTKPESMSRVESRKWRACIWRQACMQAGARKQKMIAMANLTGRPPQTKDEFKAEAERLKAQRKADRGEATKQKIERKADLVRRIRESDIEVFVEHAVKEAAKGGNVDPEKVRKWCEWKLGKYPHASLDDFLKWIGEAKNEGSFLR